MLEKLTKKYKGEETNVRISCDSADKKSADVNFSFFVSPNFKRNNIVFRNYLIL